MTALVFGLKDEFAIEAAHLGTDADGAFGHLRLWVGGTSVGDIGDTVDLSASARWTGLFLSNSGQRTRSDLERLTPKEVHSLLYGRHMEFGGAALEASEPLCRDPFLLDDVGESSWRDRSTVLVVRRSDGKDRIIVHQLGTEHMKEVLTPAGAVDTALVAYRAWVESL